MIRDFISLFFPSFCQSCFEPLVKGEEFICLKCIAELPKTNFHLQNDNPIKSKLLNLHKLRHALAYLKFAKGGKVQRIMHNIKYDNKPEIAERLGYWYGLELKASGFDGMDYIIPVPLHASRLKMRGYNQSSYFAAGLSKALGIPLNDHSVSRAARSLTQTKKSKIERWQNVSGIFKVTNPDLIAGRHLLLVDDVVTTGSTLEACGMELEKYCETISIVVLAMA